MGFEFWFTQVSSSRESCRQNSTLKSSGKDSIYLGECWLSSHFEADFKEYGIMRTKETLDSRSQGPAAVRLSLLLRREEGAES